MIKMAKGGFRGKRQPHYVLKPESYAITADKIFGTGEFVPCQLVKKAWDFVKKNSIMNVKVTE
jgi:hypothetical protein